METDDSTKDENPKLRDACDPYIIHFEERPYYLSFENLENHVNKKDLKYRRFYNPDVKFGSLENGILIFTASSEKLSYTINLQIEKDKLHLSCDCGDEVHKLCAHAYHTLDKLITCHGQNYFEQFARKGLAELAFSYHRYFNIDGLHAGLEIKPKPETGKLYLPSDFSITLVENITRKMYPAETVYNLEIPEDIVTGYTIVCPRRRSNPPFLLPYYGKLNKAGTEVKSFVDFIRSEKDSPAINLTDEQRALNSICLEMWKLAEQLPVKLIKEPKYLPGFFPLFHLWEKALMLLYGKEFIFMNDIHLKFLRQRPGKSDMLSCKLHKERPQVKLKLNRYEDLCKLTVAVTLNNKPVHYKSDGLSFLLWIQNKGHHFYLLSSIKDAVVLEWIGSAANSITIFKPHYTTFRDGLLKQLSEYYPIEFMNGKEQEFNDEKSIYQLKPVKKQIHYSRQGKWIVVTPYVVYDNGNPINVLTKGLGWLAEKDGVEIYVQRDKQFENELKEFMQTLHPAFMTQNNTESFYLTHTSLREKNWFTKTEAKLNKAGIEIKGLDVIQ